MSWVKDKLQKYVLGALIAKVVTYLKGKKTAIGALSFLLWITIYAMPAFGPNYNWVTVLATQVRDALQAGGINLDNELFNAGVGFTVVGLIDKAKNWYKGKQDGNKPRE